MKTQLFILLSISAFFATTTRIVRVNGLSGHIQDVQVNTERDIIPQVEKELIRLCPELCEEKVCDFVSNGKILPHNEEAVPDSIDCILSEPFIQVSGTDWTWLNPYFSHLRVSTEQLCEFLDQQLPNRRYSIPGFFSQVELSWSKNPVCPKFDGLYVRVYDPERETCYNYELHCTKTVFEKILSSKILNVFFEKSGILTKSEACLLHFSIVYLGGTMHKVIERGGNPQPDHFISSVIDNISHPDIQVIKGLIENGLLTDVKPEIISFVTELLGPVII